jgi:hypothetical protein
MFKSFAGSAKSQDNKAREALQADIMVADAKFNGGTALAT